MSKHYAYVVNEEGKVEAREISVQAELPHVYLISDGLTVDDKILLEGIRKVRDGDHIEFDFEEPEEVIAHLELYAE